MKIRRKQRETRTHAVKWLFVVLIAALCFVGYHGAQGAWRVVNGWATEALPSLDNTEAFNFAKESYMYAGDGSTMLAEFQLEKRDPITIEQVSPYVLKGTVDTEDVRYYEHIGVDLAGIGRALMNNLSGGALEGASTITQQLVRNTVLSSEATEISFKRKIREAQLAIDMEKKYTKDEILVMYLNTINYGDGCYGIAAAAQNYFQTTTLDLTLAQAATLVGIPQSPTYLNPKANPEASLQRRNVVLDRMLSAGDITQEEHDAARAEPLNLNPAPPMPEKGIYAYPYFTEYARQLLLAEGNPYGVSYADLFEGGLTIYTSLDPAMQNQAEAACEAQYYRMDDGLEAAMVAIDPLTGYVKALVGGKDFYNDEWNIATQGGQPTGSTFKAFTLAAAIEQGIDPKTLIDCTSPMPLPGGKSLENFGGADYGIRSIQSATAISSNTGYYRLAEKITPAAMNEMAQRLGASFVTTNLPIATLGTENVTPLSMASAYATLATGGVKHPPVAITKIVDESGIVIWQDPAYSERVITAEVAGATTKVLRSVFDTSEGTAYGSGLASGQPIAGKTGTVVDFRGHWLVGYTPTLACSTWIGDRNYQPTNSSLTANALFQDFMSRALEGQPIVNFPETKDPEYKNAYNQEQQQKFGPKEPAAAPSVVGKTLSEAQALLGNFNAFYTEEYSSTVVAGRVISQSVSGDRIILAISKGPKPAETTPAPTPNPVPTPEPDPSPTPPAPS